MTRRYELIVSICCFLAMFVNIGLVSTAFNVFQPYLVVLPGIGDTNGSLILSFRNLVSLVTLLFVDRYYRALDCRLGVALACALTAAGFFIYSLATDLPLFLLGALVAGIGYGLGGMVCVTMLTNRWYKSKVGTAIGFAAVGSGVAGILMPFVVTHTVRASSLSTAFALTSVIALAATVLLLVFVRNSPADLGREPYGAADARDGAAATDPRTRSDAPEASVAATSCEAEADPPSPVTITEKTGATARGAQAAPSTEAAHAQTFSSPQRRILLAGMVFVGAMSIGGMSYLGVLLRSEGMDELFVASLLSLTGVCLTAGKFVTGALFDAVGTRKGTALMFVFAVLGFALLLLAPLGNAGLTVAGAALMGVGLSLGTVGISVWSLEFAQPSARAKTIKDFQVAYALGGFFMNAVPGPLKDLTGTYLVSYALMLAMAAGAAAIILRAYRSRAL